jgi:hypothetical protein
MAGKREIVGASRPTMRRLKAMAGDTDADVPGLPPRLTIVRLYRFTLNAAWSSGAADADILEMDGTDTGIDDDVRDPLGIFTHLTTNSAGLCVFQDGKYYVIGPRGIINIRLSGSELQYTHDGITWTTWHTATTCP